MKRLQGMTTALAVNYVHSQDANFVDVRGRVYPATFSESLKLDIRKASAIVSLQEIMYRRGSKGLLMRWLYGAKITTSEKDEMLICSRLAQRNK